MFFNAINNICFTFSLSLLLSKNGVNFTLFSLHSICHWGHSLGSILHLYLNLYHSFFSPYVSPYFYSLIHAICMWIMCIFPKIFCMNVVFICIPFIYFQHLYRHASEWKVEGFFKSTCHVIPFTHKWNPCQSKHYFYGHLLSTLKEYPYTWYLISKLVGTVGTVSLQR